MTKKIKDLSREFSEIEHSIIMEFSQKISVDRLDRRTSSFGTASFWLFSGITCIEIALTTIENIRQILISTQNISEGKHEINGEPITNPSELTAYLSSLTKQILESE